MALLEELVDVQLVLERTARRMDQMQVRIYTYSNSDHVRSNVVDAWLHLLEYEIYFRLRGRSSELEHVAKQLKRLHLRKAIAIQLQQLDSALEQIYLQLSCREEPDVASIQRYYEDLANAVVEWFPHITERSQSEDLMPVVHLYRFLRRGILEFPALFDTSTVPQEVLCERIAEQGHQLQELRRETRPFLLTPSDALLYLHETW